MELGFWQNLVFSSLNAGILIYIILRYGRKNISSAVEERERRVRMEMEEGEREMRKAEEIKREYEQKLANIEEEVKRIKEEGRRKLEEEISKMREVIDNHVRVILDSAEHLIKSEYNEVYRKLREEMIEYAIRRAEKLIAERIGEAENKTLLERAIKVMEERVK